MIVKVQISLVTTEAEPEVLIYDRKRLYFAVLPLSKCEGLETAMAKDEYKAFFEAKLVNGILSLDQRVADQSW